MPIYEFYCKDCHTIFNFYSRRVNVEASPHCPRCGRPGLERRMSPFAIGRSGEEEKAMALSRLDEALLEKTMAELEREAEGLDEGNPAAAVRLMRRFFQASGLEPKPAVEEAIRRMEAGEDPEQIEAELGDALDVEDFFVLQGKHGWREAGKRVLPPRVDPKLYELE